MIKEEDIKAEIASRTKEMRARRAPEFAIRAMEKHVRELAAKDIIRDAEKRKNDILEMKYPKVSQAALGTSLPKQQSKMEPPKEKKKRKPAPERWRERRMQAARIAKQPE